MMPALNTTSSAANTATLSPSKANRTVLIIVASVIFVVLVMGIILVPETWMRKTPSCFSRAPKVPLLPMNSQPTPGPTTLQPRLITLRSYIPGLHPAVGPTPPPSAQAPTTPLRPQNSSYQRFLAKRANRAAEAAQATQTPRQEVRTPMEAWRAASEIERQYREVRAARGRAEKIRDWVFLKTGW